MPEPAPRVLTDDAVASAVLGLIREAKEYVVLVTPYSLFWGHLKNEVVLAVQRDVRVSAIFQERSVFQDRSAAGLSSTRKDVEWLCERGAKVYTVPNLHAKLYLNESSVLLTSMNLLQLSSRNSMEAGIRVDGEDARALRQYAKRLAELGSLVDAERLSSAPPPWTPRPEKTRPREAREGNVAYRIEQKVRGFLWQGRCIRCNEFISRNPVRPLCDKCFAEWSRFENPDYTERYCHGCGREWKTTYAEPLCTPCREKPDRPRFPFGMGFAGGEEGER